MCRVEIRQGMCTFDDQGKSSGEWRPEAMVQKAGEKPVYERRWTEKAKVILEVQRANVCFGKIRSG